MFAKLGRSAKSALRAGSVKGSVFVTGLIFTLLMAGIFVFKPGFLRILELKVYDTMFQITYSDKASDQVVIVDLDEESLTAFGQWPWPRYRVALMLEKIRRQGAVSIGLDMVFAEEDRTSPRIIRDQLRDELGVNIDFTGLPQGLEDNDLILANILEGGPYILGYYFDMHKRSHHDGQIVSRANLHPLQLAIVGPSDSPPLHKSVFEALEVTGNIPALSQAAPGSGFMNVAPDADGVIRRVPLIMSYEEEYYPSLALGAVMQLLGTRQAMARTTSGGAESIRIANLTIPLDAKGQLLLNFRGPSRTFTYISARDILRDQTEANAFKDKIVFVGTSAAGLKDIRTMPLDPIYPGVETHATVVDNILTGEFLHRPDWALGLELVFIIAAGMMATVFLVWLGGLWMLAPMAVFAAGSIFGTLYTLKNHGMYFSPFMPLLTLAGNFSLLTFQKFWLEEKEKRKIKNTFEHYLSPDVIKRVMKNPDLLKLGGEKKNLSILFSDIRSFTNISESMSPQELVTFMNEYLSAMTDIILKNGGTLDKYMGDAIMAFFGAPEDIQDHALVAGNTALEMLEKLNECRDKWCLPGPYTLEIGIGISSGEVIVGNMGSRKRFSYTVMGDQVNLASRLEGLTKEYGVKTLISGFTREQAGEKLVCREIDLVRVKGKEQPVAVYEPFAGDDSTRGGFDFIPSFEQGLASYRGQEWKKAETFFNKVLKMKPGDKPSLIYIDRCRKMALSPPGPEWDGVWIMKTK
jgi:adenylate cyclase